LRKYAALSLGALILAFGVYNIHSRCAVTEGGVLGLSLLIRQWTGISPGISCFLLNAAAYVTGIFFLGAGFLADSILCAVLYSVWYALLERIGPVLPDLSGMPLAAAVLGAVFVGIGTGLIVRYDCASSGDDALALVCHKLTGLKVSRFFFISDLSVLLASLSYIPARRIAWSLLTVTLSSLIIELLRKKEKSS